jgi:hypothetical protein
MEDLMQRIKKIGELMGERAVFRIGFEGGKLEVLSVDRLRANKEKAFEAASYIG